MTTRNYSATLNGKTLQFSEDEFETTLAEFVQANGGGVPRIVECEPSAEPTPAEPTPAAPEALPVDATARATGDALAARASGFALREPLYQIGTKVNALGVDNARRSRQEFDAMPSAIDAFREFADKIGAERRRDRVVKIRNMRMTEDGRMLIQWGSRTVSVAVTEPAFRQLVSARLGIRGSAYLAECWPELRAFNVNQWIAAVSAAAKDDDDSVVLKVREGASGTEIFGAVTENYQGGLDAAAIATALANAAPQGSKGVVSYDGTRAKFDLLFHSDVAAEDYVAGEIFKAGATVRTDDIGGGSIRTAGSVLRNLCLNLIVLDRSEQETARIRHIGDLDGLSDRFAAGFKTALQSVDHFRRQWGYANAEAVLATPTAALVDQKDITTNDLVAGLFWAQLRSLPVFESVRGNKRQVVAGLVESVMRDDRRPLSPADVTRAHIVNGWTRYAHEVASSDPWLQDSIERAASSLLPGVDGKARPLPFEVFAA